MVLLPVKQVMRHCNPYGQNVWDNGVKFTRAAVRKALQERRLISKPGSYDHAGRIAFLVENEDTTPIDIDVGIPAVGFVPSWMITDGNHRLAAAIYAGREYIPAEVSGQIDYAKRLFGVEGF